MDMAGHILLLGAGKSATVLIDYLKEQVKERQWQLTVADADLASVSGKVGRHTNARAVQLDITDEQARHSLIREADVVISMMPPALHYLVAVDCIEFGKHLLTASYIDDKIRLLEPQIREKGLLFLCEMGLDPGIDHMSAMQLIHRIEAAGGVIKSFRSHCGGLVAPVSDDNPWHYKISWNPRNVVLAGKAGAVWKEAGTEKHLIYEDMFRDCGTVEIPSVGSLAYYPNRDSLSYTGTYGLETVSTFMRTTLRYPDFCTGWQQVVSLKLTDETVQYDTRGLTIAAFFKQHLSHHRLDFSFDTLADGKLKQQLLFLGLDSEELIDRGQCTAADIMQWLLEKKLVLHPHDKDMIVMLHEIDYELAGTLVHVKSSLVVEGEDSLRTAMAKTVGLPLGIAAVLLMDGVLTERGLHIPVSPAIYGLVLDELKDLGILFEESDT